MLFFSEREEIRNIRFSGNNALLHQDQKWEVQSGTADIEEETPTEASWDEYLAKTQSQPDEIPRMVADIEPEIIRTLPLLRNTRQHAKPNILSESDNTVSV